MPTGLPREEGIRPHLLYIGITESDIAALREVRALVEVHAGTFVERFYAHLKSFAGTRALLTDEHVVRRLLEAQRTYLLSLFDANFDEAYFQHRRVIGQTHFRIGLDFRWYIGAYELYLDFFVSVLQNHYRGEAAKVLSIHGAFRKAALLDMSIVLEAYHEGDKAALQSKHAQVLHQEKLAAVGLLASGFAHEIGNPLASIQVISDHQLRKNLDPALADKFRRIHEQVGRVSAIVRQLVNFARPSPAAMEPIQVNEVLESVAAIARISRSAKTVEVRFDLDPQLPLLTGSRDQLSQVFLNLLLNAIDATATQAGTVIVRSLSSGRGTVLVSVSDNGCGIADADKSKLFSPFFTTKEAGKGTGLGLHVSEGIVRQHGGEIRVESAPNRGSTFTVELPIRGPSGTPPPPASNVHAKKETP